jgi:hypothetical protein
MKYHGRRDEQRTERKIEDHDAGLFAAKRAYIYLPIGTTEATRNGRCTPSCSVIET